MPKCEFCTDDVILEDPDNYREVSSWVNGPKLDGPKLRQQTGKFAHKHCIEAIEHGQAPDQPELFEDLDIDSVAERCTEEAVKGTGYGICDTALDGHGECPNAYNHTHGRH